MAEKGNPSQSKAEEVPVRTFSDTFSSNLASSITDLPWPEPRAEDLSSPHNNGGAATKATRPRNPQSKGKRRNASTHLRSVGLIAAICAIPLAYWQGTVQSSHSKFERNQRVVELSLTLAGFWETQLDQETRYRAGRFTAKLKSLKTDDEKRSLVSALLDNNNLLDSNAIPQNQLLYELIKPDLGSDNPDNPDGSKATPVVAVARYKAALIRVLNTMEVIAIVKEHSKELPEALVVLDSAYAGAIQQRYKDLTVFIEEYRKRTAEGRIKPAWAPLTKMVEEEDRKLKESAARLRP